MSRKTGRARRLAFFDRGNIQCPICLTPFSRNAVAKGSIVTLEHAPPKALGGAVICLTCADCNAGVSRKIDQAVAMADRATMNRNAGRGIEVALDIFGTKHTTYLSPEGGLNSARLPKLSRSPLAKKFLEDHPEHDIHMLAEIKRGPVWDIDKGITLTLKRPEPRHLAVSWLRSEYLLVFSLLGRSGYRYAGSEAIRLIREQIMHPDRELVPSLLYDFSPFPTPKNLIAIQDSAKPYCWIVKLDKMGVILPHGGITKHYNKVIGLPDQIRSLKRSWNPTPFGQIPSFELSLRQDSRLDTCDLFGNELQIPVKEFERRCIVANQQGPICTFIPSGPLTLRPTSHEGSDLCAG